MSRAAPAPLRYRPRPPPQSLRSACRPAGRGSSAPPRAVGQRRSGRGHRSTRTPAPPNRHRGTRKGHSRSFRPKWSRCRCSSPRGQSPAPSTAPPAGPAHRPPPPAAPAGDWRRRSARDNAVPAHSPPVAPPLRAPCALRPIRRCRCASGWQQPGSAPRRDAVLRATRLHRWSPRPDCAWSAHPARPSPRTSGIREVLPPACSCRRRRANTASYPIP